MNYIVTIIITLIFSLKIQAQGGETKWISPPLYKIKVSDVVYEDAEKSNILTDRIVISFIRNEKCQIENYEVKQGKLKSFSEWAKNESENIIREWEKNNPCKNDGKRENVNLPIQINF